MTKLAPKLEFVLQVVFIGLLVAIVLAQANPFYHSPNRDGGLFMYIGDRILKGDLLYIDIWDNKGPLIFYLNALGLFLGRGLRWGVWGLEYAFLFFAAFFGFSLIKNLWGLISAMFGTWIWLSGFNGLARGGNFTEDYSLLFNFAALYLFWLHIEKGRSRLYLFIIGMTFSLSFLLRANNIGIQLTVGLVLLLSAIFDRSSENRLTDLIWIGLGSLAVFALVGLYFQLLGTLNDMIVAGYTYNFFYSSGGIDIGELIHSVTRGAGLLSSIFIIAILGLVALVEKLPDSFRPSQRSLRYLYFLILIGWPIEMVLSGLSGRNYPHYFICWLPYIGILSGLLAHALLPAFNERLNKMPLVILLVGVALISALNFVTLDQYKTAFTRLLTDRSAGVEFVHPVAKYVRENTKPEERVLVWGFQPFINLMAHRESSTGVLSYPVLIESPYSDELNNWFYQELVENKPVLIVDMVNPDNDTIPFIDPVRREEQAQRLRGFSPPSNLEQVFDYIHSNYHVETEINKVVIYRLNDISQ